jgi:hypothetical protein
MGPAERVALAIVMVAGITTLLLPDRLTVRVLQTGFSGFNTALRTSMGR